MGIINENLFRKIMVGVMSAVFALNTMSVHAAVSITTGDGCDDEENIFIDPTLALCTTHVYNIGGLTNPSDDATRQLMQEVIALKTTVITQQMYKQYEYLNATVRRLKTQMKKAVLTSKLEAAGASNSENSSSSSSSSNRNIVLDGANDCSAYGTTMDILQCLQKNSNLIRSAFSTGNVGEGKRQLEKDLNTAYVWATISEKQDDDLNWNGTGKCAKSNMNDRNNRDTCIQYYQQRLIKSIEAVQKENAKQNNPWGYR